MLQGGKAFSVGLHKGGVFQIAAEDGVPDVDDNGLGCLCVL